MGKTQVNIAGAVLPDDVDRVDYRAAGVHLVVHDDDVVALYVAHQSERFRILCHPPFLDQCQGHIQFSRQVARLLGKAQVRSDDDCLLEMLVAQVVGENRKGSHSIAWDAKETLDLVGVQVERDVTVGAGDAYHISHQAGNDRHAGLILLVGAGVCQIRDDRCDTVRRGPLERVQKDQQLHQIVIDR